VKSGKNCARIMALVVMLLFALPITSHADDAKDILQVYVDEQALTIFTALGINDSAVSCTISNQDAAVLAIGSIYDDIAQIRTIVLVDVSASMPSSVRSGVLATLKRIVEDKSPNEEIKMVTFSEEMVVLQDFSGDRYDLAVAIDNVKFDGKKSMIYDALYNTIPQITRINERPTFHRTIVITDGVDDYESGVTKEELFLRLQSERYPVDVIAVSKSETVENKELAAIVRMSNGRYFSLLPNTDAGTLTQSVKVGNHSYLEVEVPAALLDGTTRQVDISDGAHTMSFDMKFPVFQVLDADPQISATPEPIATTEPTEAPIVTMQSSTQDKDTPRSLANLFGEYTIVIYTIIGIVLVIAAVIVLVIVVIRGNKGKSQPQSESAIVPESVPSTITDKTEYLKDLDDSESQYTIKLSNPGNPSEFWTLPVGTGIPIGRAEHCPVRLDDKSVSREQCMIMANGNGLSVHHLGSTNKTTLNGGGVEGSAPLQSGDLLKFGRASLRVDYIQMIGSPPTELETRPKYESGNTESIF